MAGEPIQAIPATSLRSRGALAGLNACGVLVAAIVLVVPLAVDPFGLRAFLPVKQAVLLFGSALAALVATVRYAEKAWREDAAHARQRAAMRSGAWLTAAAIALWSWSLIAVTPRALNPTLHLGFGWACLSAYLVVYSMALLYAQQARIAGERQNFELLLGAVAVAALAMACHACLQAANMDPLAWLVGRPVQESGRWRIFTTTGNPDWTAEFLAAAAPIAVWWASRFTRGAVWLWLLFIAAILPTGSRLGLAGLLLGAAIHTWVRRRDNGKSRTPLNLASLFFAGLIALAALALLL
ncbi:MAG TPA: hypothetical protein VFY94_07675, partial [Rhodanobacteraceae bacterium]|nr:hypothetical protein [Rhodanobacteraceae bacterium]